MSVTSKSDWTDQYGEDLDTAPWNLPGDIQLSTMDGTERWVSIHFYKHSPLVKRTVRQYVEASDNLREKNDHPTSQERRLAFVLMLRAIAAGCEELAQDVLASHDRHEANEFQRNSVNGT